MAFLHVQGVTNAGAGVTTVVVTISATGHNNLVVVGIKLIVQNITVVSVVDSAGNTYAAAAGPIDSSTNVRGYMYYGVQTTAGATTVTVTVSGAATFRCFVSEFSGGATSNAAVFDKVATNTGSGVTASVTLSPSAPGNLIVANIGPNPSISSHTLTNANYTASIISTSVQYYRLSSTTSETAPVDFLPSAPWNLIASSFKPSTSGALSQGSPLRNSANLLNLQRI